MIRFKCQVLSPVSPLCFCFFFLSAGIFTVSVSSELLLLFYLMATAFARGLFMRALMRLKASGVMPSMEAIMY